MIVGNPELWELVKDQLLASPPMLPRLPRFEALNVAMPRRSLYVERAQDEPQTTEWRIERAADFACFTVSAEELRCTPPLDLMWRLTGRP